MKASDMYALAQAYNESQRMECAEEIEKVYADIIAQCKKRADKGLTSAKVLASVSQDTLLRYVLDRLEIDGYKFSRDIEKSTSVRKEFEVRWSLR